MSSPEPGSRPFILQVRDQLAKELALLPFLKSLMIEDNGSTAGIHKNLLCFLTSSLLRKTDAFQSAPFGEYRTSHTDNYSHKHTDVHRGTVPSGLI
jgi:hypothetical protein